MTDSTGGVEAGQATGEMSYPVWICDGCGEVVSRAEGATDGYCAGSITMGTAHEDRPMRATVVVEAVLSPETVEKVARELCNWEAVAWGDLSDDDRAGYRADARSVLKAAGFSEQPVQPVERGGTTK